jgi:DeoR/GlpR family transcriptional regulator of sugar metabolism
VHVFFLSLTNICIFLAKTNKNKQINANIIFIPAQTRIPMLKEERFRVILDKVKIQQKVLSSGLSQELGVSEDTIRRDLNELANAGYIHKVHGGALPRSPVLLSYKERESYAQQNKLEIARKAITLVKEGQVIILDGGTTTLQIARLLPGNLPATVFTNSIPVAFHLADHPSIEVIFAGGKLLKSSQVTLGLETVETFRSIRADLCFLGVCSIHYEVGISVPNREEAQVKQAMIAAAAQVAALATAEKIGTAETYVAAPINEVDLLITDTTIPADVIQLYRGKGVEVL